MSNRHDKFKAYWESQGKPALECCDPQIENWTKIPDNAAFLWIGDSEYRISGDPHWELRKEWVNSDFTLPIEQFIPSDEYGDDRWTLIQKTPRWDADKKYRKAEAVKSDWVPHIPGNPMPVARDTEVEIELRSGVRNPGIAGNCKWGKLHDSEKYEVVAYRVIGGREKVRKQMADHVSGEKVIDWNQAENLREITNGAIKSIQARYESDQPLPADELGVNHPMYAIFMDAIEQATGGKGQRHGGARTPFLEQPWHQIAKHTGFRGLVFQAVKKAQEACGKDDYEAFERELLGALVYGAMSLIHVRKHGFTKEVKADE